MIFQINVRRHGDAWWLFVLLIIAINLPNLLPWEAKLYPHTWHFDFVERLFKCTVIASLLLAGFAKPWKAWLIAWILVLWWLPISVAVRWVSETPITSYLIGMAMASSPGEWRNLAFTIDWPWILGFLIWNVGIGVLVLALRQHGFLVWQADWRKRLTLVCLSLLLFFGYMRWQSGAFAEPHPVSTVSQVISDEFATADRAIGGDADLPLAFPYELPWAIAQYFKARATVEAVRRNMVKLPPSHSLKLKPTSPDIVVFVIGESSSRRAWRLFNSAAQATTPELDELKRTDGGLHLFTNVVAQSTSTRQAVPSMLTAQPLLWPDGRVNAQATQSIISLAREAGYRTTWMSNQAAVGKFDGVIAAYADEAQTKVFLNPASFTSQGTYDEVLLPPFANKLSLADRQFFVLHTMGNHFQFEHRYPKATERFFVGTRLEMAYLNSVAYADHFLANIIRILKENDRKSVLIFSSDHGQGLPDKACRKNDINRATRESYEVPAFIWLSQAYRAANPQIDQILKSNEHSPHTNGAVYQTLRDLMEIRSLEAQFPVANESLLSLSNGVAVQRVVSPDQRWVDFRKSVERNSCFIGAG